MSGAESVSGLPGVAAPERDSSSRHIYLVFAGLVLVMLLDALDSTIVSTALPTIVGDLGGLRPPLVGRDGLSLGADDRDAAVREAG